MKRIHLIVLVALGTLALAPDQPAFGRADGKEEAKKLVDEAQELAKDQKLDEAIANMHKAIKLAPRNDLYLALTSDYERKAGQYAEGLKHALEAVKLNDKVGAYFILVAASAYGDQDLDRAREYCDLVIKRAGEFGPGAVKDARTLQEAIAKRTFTIHWNLDPKKVPATAGGIRVAVPKASLPYMTSTYEVTGAQSHRLIKGDANDVLQLVPQGSKPIELTMKVVVEPYTYKKQLTKQKQAPLPADVRPYLGACEGVNPKSPALVKVVSGLKSDNPVDTVKNILAWMKKNVEYKLDKKASIVELDFKTVDEIVERGHAECRGYTMLFTALCRAAEIPARPVWGLTKLPPTPDMPKGEFTSHNWAEFYVSGCGWVPVDPQKPETIGCLPTNCVRMFMDVKKSKTTTENQPLLNLLYMNGPTLKYEETR